MGVPQALVEFLQVQLAPTKGREGCLRLSTARKGYLRAKARTCSGSTASVPQWHVGAGRGLGSTGSISQRLVDAGGSPACTFCVLRKYLRAGRDPGIRSQRLEKGGRGSAFGFSQ